MYKTSGRNSAFYMKRARYEKSRSFIFAILEKFCFLIFAILSFTQHNADNFLIGL